MFLNKIVKSDIQYTYEEQHEVNQDYHQRLSTADTAVMDKSSLTCGVGGPVHRATGHQGSHPNAPTQISPSGARVSNGNPAVATSGAGTITTSPNVAPVLHPQQHHASHHPYSHENNSAIIVENANSSPLLQKQNPILNQTMDHLQSHDENTDLNVSNISSIGIRHGLRLAFSFICVRLEPKMFLLPLIITIHMNFLVD